MMKQCRQLLDEVKKDWSEASKPDIELDFTSALTESSSEQEASQSVLAQPQEVIEIHTYPLDGEMEAIEVESFKDGDIFYDKINCPRTSRRRPRRKSDSLFDIRSPENDLMNSLDSPVPSSNLTGRGDDKSNNPTPYENDAEFSIFDAFQNACLIPCSTYHYNKSILRKHNEELRRQSNPLEATVVSDRQVSFSQLNIAEYDMTLGNHPSAVSGPPVMLDWDSEPTEKVITVDDYEESRQPRRKRKQLKLSFQDRRGILFEDKGFTEQEVNAAWAEALHIRKQRQETLNRGLILMFLDDVWESSCRKYNKLSASLGTLI